MPVADQAVAEPLDDPFDAPRRAALLLRSGAGLLALAVLLLNALIPGIQQAVFRFLGFPVMGNDLAVATLAPIAGLLLWPTWRMAGAWWPIVGAMAFACAYGVLSVSLWSGVEIRNGYGPQLFVIACTIAALLVPLLLVGAEDDSGLVVLLDRLTIAIALIVAIYTAKSWYASALGLDFIRLQEQRTSGPLASPSVLHFPTLPALGWAVARLLALAGRRRLLWLAVTAALALALVSTRSRGALLACGVFAVLGVVRIPDRRLRGQLLGLILLVGLTSAAAVFAQSSTDRLGALQDDNRQLNFDAVSRALAYDPVITLRGWGLGHFWNWYPTDVMSIVTGPSIYEYGFLHIQSQFGTMLYHPHSLILFLLAELGLVGLVLLVVLWGSVGWCVVRARTTPAALLAAALLGSTNALVVDLLVFKSFAASAVWWVYLFAALRLCRRPPPDLRRLSPAA